jgi:hypothetical protein
MRTLFLALLLTLASAGAAGAQERVRTGPLPSAAAPAAPVARGGSVPARVRGAVKVTARSIGAPAKGARASAAVRGGALPQPPRVKRPASRP